MQLAVQACAGALVCSRVHRAHHAGGKPRPWEHQQHAEQAAGRSADDRPGRRCPRAEGDGSQTCATAPERLSTHRPRAAREIARRIRGDAPPYVGIRRVDERTAAPVRLRPRSLRPARLLSVGASGRRPRRAPSPASRRTYGRGGFPPRGLRTLKIQPWKPLIGRDSKFTLHVNCSC